MGGVATETGESSEIVELRKRVMALNAELFAAAQVVTSRGGSVAIGAVVTASQRFVAEHRRLWALEHPDVDYDAVFGGETEP